MVLSEKKLVIRLLPPTLDQTSFFNQLEQIVSLNDLQKSYYVGGRLPSNPYEYPLYSRCYLFFKSRQSATDFVLQVEEKPFTDANGDSMIPQISNSLFKKIIDKNLAATHEINSSDGNNEEVGKGDAFEQDEIFIKFKKLYDENKLEQFNLTNDLSTQRQKQRKGREKHIAEKALKSVKKEHQLQKKKENKRIPKESNDSKGLKEPKSTKGTKNTKSLNKNSKHLQQIKSNIKLLKSLSGVEDPKVLPLDQLQKFLLNKEIKELKSLSDKTAVTAKLIKKWEEKISSHKRDQQDEFKSGLRPFTLKREDSKDSISSKNSEFSDRPTSQNSVEENETSPQRTKSKPKRLLNLKSSRESSAEPSAEIKSNELKFDSEHRAESESKASVKAKFPKRASKPKPRDNSEYLPKPTPSSKATSDSQTTSNPRTTSNSKATSNTRSMPPNKKAGNSNRKNKDTSTNPESKSSNLRTRKNSEHSRLTASTKSRSPSGSSEYSEYLPISMSRTDSGSEPREEDKNGSRSFSQARRQPTKKGTRPSSKSSNRGNFKSDTRSDSKTDIESP